MTLPSGATTTPLHELHSATCVQHVGIWSVCVCERACVGNLCAHSVFVSRCLQHTLIQYMLQSCMIWHILSPEHFAVSPQTIAVYVCGN